MSAIPSARAAPMRLAGMLLFLLVGGLLVTVPRADAARGLTTGLYAPEYFSPDTSIRDRWFDATVEANTGIVRLIVQWRVVAGEVPPSDPTDPSSSAYDFSEIDRAVREAHQRGLDIMFTVYGAPDWAEGPGRPSNVRRPGTWKPDPAAFGDFATALARRYSGSHPDPEGSAALPRVRHYEVWNEPNLIGFLSPQWEGGKPASPSIYRELLNSAAEAVKSVRRDNLVVGPGTSAFGHPRGGDQMRPLLFLRELLCLKGRNKLKAKPCPERPKLDIVSHHPISINEGPHYTAEHPDDVSSGDFGKVRRTTRAAEKVGTLGGRAPLWVTEYWWLSKPPSPRGVNPKKQARWIEESLYVFWKDGAQVAIDYLLRDHPTYATGLFFADGREKPAYEAFSFPFVTDRRSRNTVAAWGKAPETGKLRIELRKGRRWKLAKRLAVADGDVFKTGIRLRGAARFRASIGDQRSLVWRQKR